MSEFQQLTESTIPHAREVLQDNYKNLLKVADYCDSNYDGAQDKRKALEETMAFTTQSLASVAYQISTLANSILRILDLQATEVRHVEGSICSVTQDQSTQLARTGTLARRGTKTSAGQSPGSLRRSHRTLEPIQSPVIPDAKLPPASLESSPSSSTEVMGNSGLKAPTEPPPPPPLPFPFPPPMEEDDIPPPPQADVLPPPPLAMDDLPPLSALDLDFPASPPPPPLDVTDLELLEPPVLPSPPPLEKLQWPPDTYLEKVVTLYPYTRQNENELSFEEGAVLYVTRRYSDGWCQGVSSDAEGLFPGNYVEPLH
ncbi:ABI gene family member 3 isoform X2 [Heteronotia binoei]|uniref:ABI gene family member 3 isoform X2 n=1 Tax=Heteronotia binoei TaxID=13085 RepID=UPI00292D6BC5|nr:ABI gene family member 3 isoform X2 [Heteronotia binoei]